MTIYYVRRENSTRGRNSAIAHIKNVHKDEIIIGVKKTQESLATFAITTRTRARKAKK